MHDTVGAGGQDRGIDARIVVVAEHQRATARRPALQFGQQRREPALGERQVDDDQLRLQPVRAGDQRRGVCMANTG